jgi:hypothetical protein
MTKLDELRAIRAADQLALFKAKDGWYASEDEAFFKARDSHLAYIAEIKKKKG